MGNRFTGKAERLWRAIPAPQQAAVLDNVWCAQCSSATTMHEASGSVKRGDLVLRGICGRCGGVVVRLVESS